MLDKRKNIKMNNKFNILFEELMNEFSNYSEIHDCIVKIYDWDLEQNDFTKLNDEILNFQFKEGGLDESEELESLTYDLDQCDENKLKDNFYKKVDFIDKNTQEVLLSYITDINNLNKSINVFKFEKNTLNSLENNYEDLYNF